MFQKIGAGRHSPDPGIAAVAALIGDPARASMLYALLDGGERTAGDLAYFAGVARNAASAHLSKLRSGGLVCGRAEGRKRLFRLTNEHVARAIEALALIAPPAKIVELSQSRISFELRHARRCYDHLAGRLGVAVTDRLVERGIIQPLRDKMYRLTGRGNEFFSSLDIDADQLQNAPRSFARQCLDWSERRPHLAGALGAALCDAFIANHWVTRKPGGRALKVTAAGEDWLRCTLDVSI